MDASYFLRGLIQRGLPEHIAQGFLMNAQHESGLNPGINEAKPLVPGSRGGFGLMQWTGPRRRELEAFAGQRGTSVSDPDMQMDFLMSELQGPEKSAWSRIQQAKTSGEAGAAIVNAFLRPAEQHRARREREYLGGGLLNAAVSTKSPEAPMNGILGQFVPQKDGRTFGQRFKDGMKDGSTWDAIAMGLNTMRGQEADSGLASMLQGRMQGRKDERRINQTAAWLRSQGREDLAAAIEAGLMEGGAAMQTMMQSQAQQQEKNQTIDWLRSIGRDDLADAAASGALPIGEAFNAANQQDKNFTQLSPAEVESLGLPPGAYQRGADGKISQIGGGGVNVSIGGGPELGKLSTDHGYILDPATGKPVIDPATGLPTAAPIPGSPAARDISEAATKEGARTQQAANAASIVVQDIDKAIGQVSNWTAGAGSALARIPGSGARDLQASLDTVRANIGFDRLQQMRESSPTGGALGGIAIQELEMLQAVLGSLDASQSPEQLRANLERLKQVYEPIAAKAAAYPNAAEFGFGGAPSTQPAQPQDPGQPAQIGSRADYDALPSGSRFVAPDGSVRIKP